MTYNESGLRPSTLHVTCRTLGLPADWLRNEALAGRIPCLRAGDRLLFDLETVRVIVNAWAKTGVAPVADSERDADTIPSDRDGDGFVPAD